MFPAVLLLTSRKALQGSQLLDICQAAKTQGKTTASDTLSAWRNLQWLPKFKEWAIFGFIACPGTARRPLDLLDTAAEMLRSLSDVNSIAKRCSLDGSPLPLSSALASLRIKAFEQWSLQPQNAAVLLSFLFNSLSCLQSRLSS